MAGNLVTLLCECDDWACRETVSASIEQLQVLRADPQVVLIAKSCKTVPDEHRKLVDEREDFFAYEVT